MCAEEYSYWLAVQLDCVDCIDCVDTHMECWSLSTDGVSAQFCLSQTKEFLMQLVQTEAQLSENKPPTEYPSAARFTFLPAIGIVICV